MDARIVQRENMRAVLCVLFEELKSGRKSDRLANRLGVLTTLE
jgi:hypothetical protein